MSSSRRPYLAGACALALLATLGTIARSQPGELKWLPLEELLNGNIPLTSAVRTRGVLEASPRVPGTMRRYFLTLPFESKAVTVQRRLPIQPVGVVQATFDFDADSLNMREIEVVGSFQVPAEMGGTGGTGQILWFWAYEVPKGEDDGKVDHKPGELAIEDLAERPPTLAKETITVIGQFRGSNLFGDLDAATAPKDAWVLKEGEHAVWVVGKPPKGRGFSLDPGSKSDTRKWLEVTGKLERIGDVLMIRARQVALIARPAPAETE